LPHLPSLEIREGAIDLLIALYKLTLPSLSDYLTKDGEVNRFNVDVLLAKIGTIEDEIFIRRRRKEEEDKRMQERRAHQASSRKQAAAGPTFDKVQASGIQLFKLGQERAGAGTLSPHVLASMCGNKPIALRNVFLAQARVWVRRPCSPHRHSRPWTRIRQLQRRCGI
jgi:hypothetical protein